MRAKEDAPLLIAQGGPFNGQRWFIENSLLIGRDADCDIVIADRQISRHHACLTLQPEGVLLEDLSSKNGTHLNGVLLKTPAYLRDGDSVQVALAQQFVFLSSDATVPLDGEIDFSQVKAQNSAPVKGYALTLDARAHRVWVRGVEVVPPLSVAQFNLLAALYRQNREVVGRADLIEAVWGENSEGAISEQALDALVRRLRDRLAEADPTHAYVVTVRGHGLRLDNPNLG
ncbi:MAG: hypothetical protein OHK0052_25580 [Anaerolineales bacterium]